MWVMQTTSLTIIRQVIILVTQSTKYTFTVFSNTQWLRFLQKGPSSTICKFHLEAGWRNISCSTRHAKMIVQNITIHPGYRPVTAIPCSIRPPYSRSNIYPNQIKPIPLGAFNGLGVAVGGKVIVGVRVTVAVYKGVGVKVWVTSTTLTIGVADCKDTYWVSIFAFWSFICAISVCIDSSAGSGVGAGDEQAVKKLTVIRKTRRLLFIMNYPFKYTIS